MMAAHTSFSDIAFDAVTYLKVLHAEVYHEEAGPKTLSVREEQVLRTFDQCLKRNRHH